MAAPAAPPTDPASSARTPVPANRRGLLRILGVLFGATIIVGNTIGSGILRTPGEVAAALPSPAWFLGVWIAGGFYALMGAMTMAELAAALDVVVHVERAPDGSVQLTEV